MHLIELIAELEAVKVRRGNVKLVDVIVMGAGDSRPLANFADRPIRQAPAQLTIDVTGLNDDQVEELKAENPTAKFIRRAPEVNNAPGEDCNHVHVIKGACTLGIGHQGDHVWVIPDATASTPTIADLSKVMETAAAKLPVTQWTGVQSKDPWAGARRAMLAMAPTTSVAQRFNAKPATQWTGVQSKG